MDIMRTKHSHLQGLAKGFEAAHLAKKLGILPLF